MLLIDNFIITLALSWNYYASKCYFAEIKNILVLNFIKEILP